MKSLVVAVVLLTAVSASASTFTISEDTDLKDLTFAPEIPQGLDANTGFTEPGANPQDSYNPPHLGAGKLEAVSAVQAPEPRSAALLFLGFLGLALGRRVSRRLSRKR